MFKSKVVLSSTETKFLVMERKLY